MKALPLKITLRWRLILSYIPVILIPILLLNIVMHNVAERGITLVVTQAAQRRAQDLVGRFADYYQAHGTWDGVSSLFTLEPASSAPTSPEPKKPKDKPPDPTAPDQLLITDTKGVVVAGQDPAEVGHTLSADVLALGAPILVDDQPVGTLVIGAAFGLFDQQQRQILDTMNSAVMLMGIITALIAMLLGLWLSGQIVRPVKQLMRGVRQLTSGHWTMPLSVQTGDEFGELTRAFNQMAGEVTYQQELRRQLVADVAHDLRTPLSAIRLEVEAIEAGFQTPAEATISLREEIDWLEQLVEDLRTLSLLDAGQVQLHLEQTNILPFLQSIATFWQPLAASYDHEFVLDADPNLPLICMDSTRLRQAIDNLISNALHHTPPKTRVVLHAQRGPNAIIIQVSDNGPGISPHDLPHIFDRFYRADRSRHRSGSGSGLGLNIARHWVNLHQGSLDVQSVIGQDTIFTICLPLQTASSISSVGQAAVPCANNSS